MKTLEDRGKIKRSIHTLYGAGDSPENPQVAGKLVLSFLSQHTHKGGGKKVTKKEMEGATTASLTTVGDGSVAAWGSAERGGEIV